jgi:hypothetical protein
MVEPSSFSCFATRPGLCGFRSRPSSRPPTYGAGSSPLPSFPLGATTSLANVIEQFSEGGGLKWASRFLCERLLELLGGLGDRATVDGVLHADHRQSGHS